MNRLAFWYALPALPMALPTLPLLILLPTFYLETYQVPLAVTGAILFAVRVFDGFTDLVAATLCDKPLGRLGTRHSWMILGSLLCAPGILWVFVFPYGGHPVQLLVSLCLLYSGWTLIQVPYHAWITDLSQQQGVRLHLSMARESAGIIGLLLSAALPALLQARGYSSQASFQWLGLGTLLLGALALTLCLLKLPILHFKPTASIPWRQLFCHPAFVRLNSIWGLNGIANGIPAVLFPLVITEALSGTEADRARLLLIYFCSAVVAMPIINTLSKQWQPAKLWCLSMLSATAIFAATPFLAGDNLPLFYVICILTGLTLGADLTLPSLLQAELADHDRTHFKTARPSAFFAAQSLVAKVALGCAGLIATLLYDAREQFADIPPETALLVIYAWLPCVLKITACCLLWRYTSRPKPTGEPICEHG